MNEPGYERFLKMEAFTKDASVWDVDKNSEYKKDQQEMEKLLAKKPTELIRPEKQRLIVYYRALGYTLDEIGMKVELSRSTVIGVVREYAKEIAKIQRLELEELLNLHYQTSRRKIEMLGGLLKRLLEELQGRSLEDVPTASLLKLILEFNKTITDAITEKVNAEQAEEPELGKASVI
jgi:hypothetical protein